MPFYYLQEREAGGDILCKFVASINVDGDQLIFEDGMGVKTTVTGRLVSADLTAGSVIVASE